MVKTMRTQSDSRLRRRAVEIVSALRSACSSPDGIFGVTGFYGRRPKQSARNLYQSAVTLFAQYSALLRAFDFDTEQLRMHRKKLGALPSLTGLKVWPFYCGF